jgi:hypothetical protein
MYNLLQFAIFQLAKQQTRFMLNIKTYICLTKNNKGILLHFSIAIKTNNHLRFRLQ